MKIRFTRDFARNWREGDEVEATFETRGDLSGYLIDCVALIEPSDFLDAVKVGTIQVIEEDTEKNSEKSKLNPCMDLCYIRYGKQYSEKCDDKCEYAHAVKQMKDAIQRLCLQCRTKQSQPDLCELCATGIEDHFVPRTVREYLEYAQAEAFATQNVNEVCAIAAALNAYDEIMTVPEKSYEVINILWHVDEDESNDGLPAKVVVPTKLVLEALDEDGDVDLDTLYDSVSDWLSDEYGFCHEGFTLEEM